MICLEVLLNGKRLCLAGVGDTGVLSAIVNWVGGLPKAPQKGGRTKSGEAFMHAGGLFNPEPHINVHLYWVQRKLQIGGEVTVKVLKAENPDDPQNETVQTAEDIREQQRQYYLQMKAQYEDDKGIPKTASLENVSLKKTHNRCSRRRKQK